MIGSVGMEKINQLNEELKAEANKREEVVIEEQKEDTTPSQANQQ